MSGLSWDGALHEGYVTSLRILEAFTWDWDLHESPGLGLRFYQIYMSSDRGLNGICRKQRVSLWDLRVPYRMDVLVESWGRGSGPEDFSGWGRGGVFQG